MNIIIASYENGWISLLMQDNRVKEIRIDKKDSDEVILGSVYTARVEEVKESLNSAFLSFASGKKCYYDLKSLSRTHFTLKPSTKPIACGDEVLIQINREAIKTKLPSATGLISLAGKNLVLTAGENRIGISSRIDSPRREELQELMIPFLSDKFGYVVRTNAAQAEDDRICREAEILSCQYRKMLTESDTRKAHTVMLQGDPAYMQLIRDSKEEELTEIMTDNPHVYENIKNYLELFMPDSIARLKLYEDKLQPLYKKVGVDTLIQQVLREKVWLKSGAYIIIQNTEAMTVIDVNTGKVDTRKNKALFAKINKEAAKEVFRQIRLRNLSGIILVDFINMDTREEHLELEEYLRVLASEDPVQTVFVDITALQIAEITRKKVRKPIKESIESIKEKQ